MSIEQQLHESPRNSMIKISNVERPWRTSFWTCKAQIAQKQATSDALGFAPQRLAKF